MLHVAAASTADIRNAIFMNNLPSYLLVRDPSCDRQTLRNIGFTDTQVCCTTCMGGFKLCTVEGHVSSVVLAERA